MDESMIKIVTAAVVFVIAVIIKKVAFKSKVSSLFRLYARRVEIDGKPVDAYGASKGEPQVLVETRANLKKSGSCFQMRVKARTGAPSLIQWENSSMAFPRGETCGVAGYSLGRPGLFVELGEDEWADLIVCLGKNGAADVYSGELASFEDHLSFPRDGSEEAVLTLRLIPSGGMAATDVRVALEVQAVEADKEVEYFNHEKAINILRTLKRVG